MSAIVTLCAVAAGGSVGANDRLLYLTNPHRLRPMVHLVDVKFEPNTTLKAVRGAPTQTTTAKVTISASPECSDETCLHPGDYVVVEFVRGFTGDYFQIDPVLQEHVELRLGDAIETTFEITVVAGAPPGKYDFDIHILDVKRGTDNRSIADNIQFEPETALLEKELQVTN